MPAAQKISDAVTRRALLSGGDRRGVRIGAAFFDLAPESARELDSLDTAMLWAGVGFLAYPVAWIIMPEEPHLLSAPLAGQHVTNP